MSVPACVCPVCGQPHPLGEFCPNATASLRAQCPACAGRGYLPPVKPNTGRLCVACWGRGWVLVTK